MLAEMIRGREAPESRIRRVEGNGSEDAMTPTRQDESHDTSPRSHGALPKT
jgi:hypothetical protein